LSLDLAIWFLSIDHKMKVAESTTNKEENENDKKSGNLQVEDTRDNVENGPSQKQILFMYSHTFLTSFGERLWGFAIPMLLVLIYPSNMWPAASLAFIETISGFFSGPSAGAWIDRTCRLFVMKVSVIGQTVSIVLASGCFYGIIFLGMASEGEVPYKTLTFWGPMLGLYLAAAINSVVAVTDSVSMKKVWVPMICQGDSKILCSVNASLRRINLVCEIGAPLSFGCLLSFLPQHHSISVSLFCVVSFNVLCLGPELFILQSLYKSTPALSKPVAVCTKSPNPLVEAVQGWHSYVNHKVFLASFAYSLLYLTVLMPGVLMTSFLNYCGIQEWEIAVFRCLCAITGILATLLATPLMRIFGIFKAGVFFAWFQWLFLVPATIASFLPLYGHHWGVYLFMGMVIISRMGLWGFDLAEVSIMQTWVDEKEAGTINAVEYSATQLFSLIPYLASIVSNDPKCFVWMVVGSSLSILSAAVLFSTWAACRSMLYSNLDDNTPNF